jgi:hypothetical protein
VKVFGHPTREKRMTGKRLGIWLLVLALPAFHGCNETRTLIGRWQANSSTYYFREDGVLFYRSPAGNKYTGRFHVNQSTDPMVVQSRLRGLYGAAGSLEVRFKVQFLTADRMRVDVVNENQPDRVLMLSRVEDAADKG